MMIRNLISTCVALFLCTFSFGQDVTFLTEDGLTDKTICKGSEIQLNLDIDPPIPAGGGSNYNVQWEKTTNPTFIRNCPFPSPGGMCSFFREIPQATTTYTVIVNGGPAGSVRRSITITVDEVPNPGLNTTIFLCGRTGIINLFDELDGGPNTGGTWSNGTGIYDTADPNGGAFTYTINGGGVCPPVSAVITVKPCGDNDSDNDGIPNATDNDSDNDGIPNSIEDGFCTATTTTPIFVLEEDFGFGGPTRSKFSEGLGLTYNPLLPQDISNDGEYNVATSTHYRTNVGFDATFLATDLIGDVDANGDIDGRYLAINMKSSVFADKPVFVARDLPVTPGIEYDFSMSIASLNNNTFERPANLTIEVVDQATNTAIFSQNSGEIANGTDNWILVQSSFIPAATVNIVTIRVINNQNIDGNGNDIGIDNVFLSTKACDFDRDGIPNSEDLDADNDGIYDIVETGNSASDTNGDGRFDGPINADGTSTTVTHNVINSDADANQNFLDIDSDNDGIVDNIEGQSTAGYTAPSGVDGDFNGVDDSYDSNGTAIKPVRTNTTANPDYIDTNSDPETGDCLVDTVEAYDTNQDGTANTVATGSDTDGDGLDDAFDTVVLDRLTGGTNANNGGTTPADFPNNHNPLTDERDWREEIGDVDIGDLDITMCDPRNLFDELPTGTLTTGTWTVPTGGAALAGGHLGTIDPGATGVLDGGYIYTLPVLAPGCPPIRYLINISIADTCRCPDLDEPIVPTPPIITCINATPLPSVTVTLAAGLEGRWYLADGVTAIPRAQNTTTFTPLIAELSVGANVFRVEAYDPAKMCTSDQVDVTITITAAPEAGMPNDTPPVPVIACAGDTTVINLFDQLTGEDVGGVWTDPVNTVVPGGTISADANIAGDYTYTVSSNGCTDTAVITVAIEATPSAGENGTLNTCTSAPSENLFARLGGTPATGGSWTDASGNPFGTGDQGVFDPSTNAAGTYIYTVGTTTCSNTATVTVTINTGANAGENGIASLCSTDASINLFDSLGGTPDTGGSWTDPSGSPFGTNDQGTLDPSIATVVSGNYTYTVSTATCTIPASSVVVVTIEITPSAGENGNLNTCTSAPSENLFARLGGTPAAGGSWTDTGGNAFGTSDQGVFDPSTDTAGIYTYTVGTATCNSTATVTVTINTGANAGENGTIQLCSMDAAVNLFDSLGGTPDTGGSWTDPAGNPFGTNDQGTLDPSITTLVSGDYTYTVSTATCTIPATATVAVNIAITPSITLDSTSCAVDRDSYSVTFVANGTWEIAVFPSGSGTIDITNSMITGVPTGTDITILAENPANDSCEGVLEVIAPDCSCPDIAEPTNPVGATICIGDPSPSLSVEVLAGQTANWYAADDTLVAGNSITFSPSDTQEGIYVYYVEALDIAENCPSDRVEVFFTISSIQEIALTADGAICVDENGIPTSSSEDLPFIDTGLSIPEFSFSWSFQGTVLAGENGSGLNATNPGEYSVTYTNAASGCSDIATIVIPSVMAPRGLSLSLSAGSFATNNDIIAVVDGDGTYEYSLDGGGFQDSNEFRRVSLGLHEVTAQDVNGCGDPVTSEIFVMGFPSFFTPNNDGRNDSWNVIADENLPEMTIYVFDRYGKLLDQIDPSIGQGWDGMFNGIQMPSDDYWFVARLADGSEAYRNHFTLKR